MGVNTLGLTIPPTYTTGTSVQARFRLYDNQPAILGATSAAQPFGGTSSGEVEDYTFTFSPTAISLASFQTKSGSNWPLILIITGGVLSLFAGLIFFTQRKHP